MMHGYMAVSYTHLDVYKRQVMSRTIDGVLEILKGRKDIKYKEGVITDYLNPVSYTHL